VLALGITHAIMMAEWSAQTSSSLRWQTTFFGPVRGAGFFGSGWATGAIIGGLMASQLPQALRMPSMLRLVPDSRRAHGDSVRRVPCGRRHDADSVWILRALGGVVAQSSLMTIVQDILWTDAIRDGDPDDGGAALHEYCAGMVAQGAAWS